MLACFFYEYILLEMPIIFRAIVVKCSINYFCDLERACITDTRQAMHIVIKSA